MRIERTAVSTITHDAHERFLAIYIIIIVIITILLVIISPPPSTVFCICIEIPRRFFVFFCVFFLRFIVQLGDGRRACFALGARGEGN